MSTCSLLWFDVHDVHTVIFDCMFQISDQGGGIPRSEIHNLFNYMYSTAPRPPSPEALHYTPLVSTRQITVPVDKVQSC